MKVCAHVIALLCLYLAAPAAEAAILNQIGHFPATAGSSWTYAVSALTTNQSGQQVMMPATETVTVTGNGVFHSEIAFANGNTTTSDNNYIQGDALYVGSTRIVMVTKMDAGIFQITTTTTTDNSYSPPQEFFPAEVFPGNVETSSGTCTTNLTTVTVTPYGAFNSSASSISTQDVRIAVAGTETVTIGAGTFSALKLVTTITVTEGGQSTPYTINAWYAEGVGLVKLASANMNRDLVDYAVNPVEPSVVQIDGKSGSYASLQGALDATVDNDMVKVRSGTMQENITFGRGTAITLSGGWDAGFASVTGYTSLAGPFTVQSGSMIMANVIIL
jgi:uncharacterized protein DUF3108